MGQHNFLNIAVDKSPLWRPNVPYVSVTVCVPQTTNCQTIDHIIIDTTSAGLRIFSQALSITLPAQVSGPPLAECALMGGGNLWGPIDSASVTMAGEPAVTVPIQVIDSTFGTGSLPFPCNSNVPSSSQWFGGNGVLGVAPLQWDDSGPWASWYFTCQNGSCTTAVVNPPNPNAVQNPVFALPVDNNGVIIDLPRVPDGGSSSVSGVLIFGIGTPNGANDPNFLRGSSPLHIFHNDSINVPIGLPPSGTPHGTPLDTASDALKFLDSFISRCADGYFFCPATTPLVITVRICTGTGSCSAPGGSDTIAFHVEGGSALFASGNSAFSTLAAFDYEDMGLPFFFGRFVFLAYPNYSGTLGTPPVWSFFNIP